MMNYNKMNLSRISMMTDKDLNGYIEAYREKRPELTADPHYSCMWNKHKHVGDKPVTWQNLKRHILTCKFKNDHKEVVNEKDSAMLFPIYDEENGDTYRSALSLMDFCYEFQVERLKPGWEHYENRILLLMIKFFSKYCNMGRAGYQQSVQQTENTNGQFNWRVKKTEDSEFIGLTNVEMFEFFCDEFKPLLKINLEYIQDSGSYNFWYLMIKGKRCGNDQAYRDMVEKAKNAPDPTRIVGPHTFGPKGEVIFI